MSNQASTVPLPKGKPTPGRSTPLFHKDFTLVVIGQIISLFGNTILRFALPLYILHQSGSPALFGLVSATSFLPMILMSPVGGIVADRVNKQRIMVVLDFITAALILGFILINGLVPLIPLVVVVLMLLYGIQGAYTPAVQASLPLLAKPEQLVSANAVVNLVQSLSGLLGPVIGGMLYGLYGLMPILIVSCVCFAFSAVLELFIRIPHQRQPSSEGIVATAKKDIVQSARFIFREKPILAKAIGLIFSFNLFLTSVLIIGLPVIITEILAMPSEMYGLAEGVLAAGGLVGGILAGVLGKKMKVQNSYRLLLLCSLGLVPMAVPLFLGAPALVSYLVITVMSFLLMAAATMFSIQILAFVQMQTPADIVGKVISILMAITMCAQPIGQVLYGILFEQFGTLPWAILLGTAVMSCLIALFSKTTFSKLR